MRSWTKTMGDTGLTGPCSALSGQQVSSSHYSRSPAAVEAVIMTDACVPVQSENAQLSRFQTVTLSPPSYPYNINRHVCTTPTGFVHTDVSVGLIFLFCSLFLHPAPFTHCSDAFCRLYFCILNAVIL